MSNHEMETKGKKKRPNSNYSEDDNVVSSHAVSYNRSKPKPNNRAGVDIEKEGKLTFNPVKKAKTNDEEENCQIHERHKCRHIPEDLLFTLKDGWICGFCNKNFNEEESIELDSSLKCFKLTIAWFGIIQSDDRDDVEKNYGLTKKMIEAVEDVGPDEFERLLYAECEYNNDYSKENIIKLIKDEFSKE